MIRAFQADGWLTSLRGAAGMAGRPLALCMAVLALSIGLTACGEKRPELARQVRKELAVKNFKEGKDIRMAVVWPAGQPEFLSGAILAAEEVNAEGGVAGRSVHLDFVDETPFYRNPLVKRARSEGRFRNAFAEAGAALAKVVTDKPEVTAVIGHLIPEMTLSAMLGYEDNGVLFLSGAVTDSRVLWSSQSMYVQLRPQDEVLTKKLAEVMKERRWASTYLVYAANRHNERIVELLKSQMAKDGIKMAGSFAVMHEAKNSEDGMRRMQAALSEIRASNVDAIVVLAHPKLGAQVIRQTRTLGVLQPFLGTGMLDSAEFFDMLGDSSGDVLITSLYRSNSYLVKSFANRFKRRFPDVEPNESAAMGYDSVRLYVEAVASANTTDPILVAQALHYRLPIWHGLMGTYSFKDSKSTTLKYNVRKLFTNKDKAPKFISVEDPD